jgi:predicted permease
MEVIIINGPMGVGKTTVGKLIVMPAVMFAAGLACGLRGPLMSILVGVSTTPVPVSSFPLVESMGGDGEFAGQLVVVEALFCFITIFGWVFLLSALGLM